MSRRQKLTIVVTCTDRKFGVPNESLRARTLPVGTPNERVEEWNGRVRGSIGATQLIDLYQGETWAQTRRLAATASRLGYQPELLVASAGLGLRSTQEFGPAYAATFARGHADSVANSAAESEHWWRALPHSVNVDPAAPSLWVASETYAVAMRQQLAELDPGAALVFGGAASTPSQVRVASDRALRSALGGTMTSLNTRAAIRWLELADGREPTDPSVRADWSAWADGARVSEIYDRQPLTDKELIELLGQLLAREPDLSKTAALRSVRTAGVACEQGRFAELYAKAVAR